MRDFTRWIPFVAQVARAAGAREQDVDDAIGEVAVRVLGTETEPENARAFLAKVARRVVVDAWRARRRVTLLGEPDAFAAPVDAPAESREEGPAFADLTAAQGRAVRLHYFEGLTVAATARQMGTTPGTVKSYLHRARARLRAADAAGRPVFVGGGR